MITNHDPISIARPDSSQFTWKFQPNNRQILERACTRAFLCNIGLTKAHVELKFRKEQPDGETLNLSGIITVVRNSLITRVLAENRKTRGPIFCKNSQKNGRQKTVTERRVQIHPEIRSKINASKNKR